MLEALSRERWARVEPLLDAALDLEGAARGGFLDAACGGDLELRADVERLLRSCEEGDGLLARPAVEAWPLLLASLTSAGVTVESRVGPYRIVREAGRGGMGAVFLAERADDQYRKRVALKVVRRGLDDGHLVRRFLEERQILASLDHPHVARLLDGGVTETGLPWFAMEYVEGLPIDRYCDQRRLGIEERLRLFLDVCEAVQYAHRNLVVHRDLKPSNILITEAGEAKLLDFGIAKLVTEGQDDSTRTGMRAMTPEYASPEQVRGDPISTATDVYSLGVVLYELLAGRRPFRSEGRPAHELERQVLEQPAELPSSAAARAGAESAALRDSTPERLARRLRGDLDTIVLTAMRKEPDRRYGGVERLAADIRLHLTGRPVTARRDSWRYRAGKFVRRNPMSVAASGLLTLLLAAFSVVTSLQSHRAARERDRAERISAFLIDLLAAPNPYGARGGGVTVKEVLDSAAVRVDRELQDQPDLRARLLGVVGRSYWGLGMVDRARATLDSAIRLRRAAGLLDYDLVQDQVAAGRLALEQSDYVAAESLGRAGLAMGRSLFGARHPNLTSALIHLAFTLRNIGAQAEGDSMLAQAVEIQRGQPRDSANSLSKALESLASSGWARGDWAGADSLYQEALDLRRERLGAAHPEVGRLQVYLGSIRSLRGDASAGGLLRAGLEAQRQALGEEHPLVAEGRRYLADHLARVGEPAAAESLYRAALVTFERIHPSRIWDLAGSLSGLGDVILQQGNPAEAERIVRRALATYETDGPPGQRWLFVDIERLLGTAIARQGRYEEAEPILLRALELRSTRWGPTHDRTLESAHALAELYEAWGKPAEARTGTRARTP